MIKKIKNQYQNLKFLNFGLCFCILVFGFWISSFAQELPSSKELVMKAREAHGKKDYYALMDYTQQCIDLYEKEARLQQASLREFPPRGKEDLYAELNNVATCYFIQGESYIQQGGYEEAKVVFKKIIEEYSFAQAWDPRGWFWSVAEKSEDTLKKMEGRKEEGFAVISPRIKVKSILKLADMGTEAIIDYHKYGEFQCIGTEEYRYIIKDPEGVSLAAGEGVYPNTRAVLKDPEFNRLRKEGRLNGNHWDFIYTDDLAANFYKWATAPEPPGVRQFYTALALERAGFIQQAIKGYYACVVHFPQAIGWTYWHTPWYVGQASISKIKFLSRRHQELKLKLEDARIRIINGFDNNINNDIFIVNPGRLVRISATEAKREAVAIHNPLPLREAEKTIGEGKVRLVKFKNGHWQLLVDNKPYVIKGITYAPTKIGQSPDEGTLSNWMDYDYDGNGLCDGPYDAWLDKNGNNIKDEDEPAVGDFKLMKDMGVNTIRIYHQPYDIAQERYKNLLRDLYENYGIMVIMGDFLGKYALGSGASWYEGTDYTNPEHQRNMLDSVRKMVESFKDEPYILMWLLGNENVYGVACNADKNPEAFFKFVNEVASMIKSIDKDHPVALCNGDTLYLDKFAEFSPAIDVFAANAYRGGYGFVSLWEDVKDEADKPVFITEYGAPAYMEGKPKEDSEEAQADYHRGCWEDILYNMAGRPGTDNSLGGVVFEWLDEWWKAYEPSIHDTKALFNGPFPDGFMHEEWLGLSGQGDGKNSPFLRQLRSSYYLYQKMWDSFAR